MKLAGNGTKNSFFIFIFIFFSSAGSICASGADQLVMAEKLDLLQLSVPTRVSVLISIRPPFFQRVFFFL